MLDAILWLTSAWDSVESKTISKCFQKCGFSDARLDAATTDDDEWDDDEWDDDEWDDDEWDDDEWDDDEWDDDEWDDADLLPLLPPGITFKDYVDSRRQTTLYAFAVHK